MKGRVLIIAGSDPSGGAGIQADIKTVTALGGYAATAVTALTVQNTTGVSAVYPVTPEIIRMQIDSVMSDIGTDAIKIGMIGEEKAAHAIADALDAWAEDVPVILDPVLVATSGDALAGGGVAGLLLERLAPLCALITPNTDEAAALSGVSVKGRDDMIAAGAALVKAGANAALIKGGHLSGEKVEDILLANGSVEIFETDRIETTSTHGTGCTLASACATGFAQRLTLPESVKRAIDYVQEAIRTAPGFGGGCGPLNHAHTLNVKG